MPFTPLHFGAVLWVYYSSRKKLDAPTLAISSTVIDLEPATRIWLGVPEAHAFFHSYLAIVLLCVPITLFIWLLQKRNPSMLRHWYGSLLIKPPLSHLRLRHILASALLGGASHILLDSFTHRTFRYTFYPFLMSPNPFWFGANVAELVQLITVGLSGLSLALVAGEAYSGRHKPASGVSSQERPG